MLVLVLVAAAVVVLLAVLVALALGVWRRSEAQPCLTEEEARENSAPLTTAILSGSGDRERRRL